MLKKSPDRSKLQSQTYLVILNTFTHSRVFRSHLNKRDIFTLRPNMSVTTHIFAFKKEHYFFCLNEVHWLLSCDHILNMCPPSVAACFRGNGAAGSSAKLPGGAVGELWSLADVGAAQKGCNPPHGLPVCTGSEQRKHKETFLKKSTGFTSDGGQEQKNDPK